MQIYFLYIRSVLEYNSSVWLSSITQEERNDLERVQRCACRIILKDEYISYESALSRLNLQNLSERRKTLALRFAKKCTTNDRFENWFPLNDKEALNLRNPEKHKVKFARTLRLCKSSIPAMQRLLNQWQWKALVLLWLICWPPTNSNIHHVFIVLCK